MLLNHTLTVLLMPTAYEVASLGTVAFVDDITPMLAEPPSFSSTAQGGYATCTMTLMCDQVTASRFLDSHVGRKIQIVNPMSNYAEATVWEGQVYTVTVDDGKKSIARTMADVSNTVYVQYTEAILLGSTYYEGDTLITTGSSDTVSQGKYGTRMLMYSTGVMNTGAANQYEDRLLYDYASPRSVPGAATVGGGGDGLTVVRVDCVGFYENFAHRFYLNSGTSTSDIGTQIAAATTSAYNDFVSTDQSNMVAAVLPIFETQEEYITVQDYVNRLCAIGGNNNRRLFFGVYEAGKPYLFEEATTTKYYIARYNASEVIIDATTGYVVPPWLVRPGYIAEFLDFLPIGIDTYADIKDNPRAFTIGTVEFRAPNILRLTPVSIDPGAVNMAKMEWVGNYLLPGTFWRLDEIPSSSNGGGDGSGSGSGDYSSYPIGLDGSIDYSNDPLQPGYSGSRPWWLNPAPAATYNGPPTGLPNNTENTTNPHP
jgi:hypothetical protein